MVASSSVSRLIHATALVIFTAMTDEELLGRWRLPDAMSMSIHVFEPREGGRERISLTYDQGDREGKASGATDSFAGTIVRLVPDELLVEVLEFETDVPTPQGAMTPTTSLDARGASALASIWHADLPRGVAPTDNERGTQRSLERLAELVER